MPMRGELGSGTRLRLEIELAEPALPQVLSEMLGSVRGGRGEVILRLGDPEGPRAELRLGRDFLLDAELAARIERLPGILSVKLDAADPVPLALVS